jgi:nitrite reductase/ring-hydroxylating ferredoxin subunit/uncharacterized membrane protein
MPFQLAAPIADRELPLIDGLADRIQPAVRSAIAASGRHGRNLIDGVWLGVPLHPPLTDVPIGAATAASMFDAVAAATGSSRADRQADGALAVAVVGALGAVATGLGEWRFLRGGTRRAATVHGLVNLGGLSLNVASLVARRMGARSAGRALSMAGLALSGTAAHIGGELSFGMGVRVDPNASAADGDQVGAIDAAVLDDGGVHGVDVGGERVVVARCSDGSAWAIAARCSHVGGPLDKGKRDGDAVICPWHGSHFDLRTGGVIEGPAVFPQPRYEVSERGGRVEVRRDRSPAPFRTS